MWTKARISLLLVLMMSLVFVTTVILVEAYRIVTWQRAARAYQQAEDHHPDHTFIPNDGLGDLTLPLENYTKSNAHICADLIGRVEKSTTMLTPPPAFELIKTFTDPTSPFAVGIFRSDKCVVVTASGFRPADDWSPVFLASQMLILNTKHMVHTRFSQWDQPFLSKVYGVLNELKPQRLVFTGHSLGAAAAGLFLYYFNDQGVFIPQEIALYTFASPRIGNLEFCQALEQECRIFRLVNTVDHIPTLPLAVTPGPVVPFQYTTPGDTIQYELNKGSWNNNHAISNYITALASPEVIFTTIPSLL